MSRFSGKVFVITGSSQGLGRAIASRVLSEGGSVVLNSRSQNKSEGLLESFKQYSERVIYVSADERNPSKLRC